MADRTYNDLQHGGPHKLRDMNDGTVATVVAASMQVNGAEISQANPAPVSMLPGSTVLGRTYFGPGDLTAQKTLIQGKSPEDNSNVTSIPAGTRSFLVQVQGSRLKFVLAGTTITDSDGRRMTLDAGQFATFDTDPSTFLLLGDSATAVHVTFLG